MKIQGCSKNTSSLQDLRVVPLELLHPVVDLRALLTRASKDLPKGSMYQYGIYSIWHIVYRV